MGQEFLRRTIPVLLVVMIATVFGSVGFSPPLLAGDNTVFDLVGTSRTIDQAQTADNPIAKKEDSGLPKNEASLAPRSKKSSGNRKVYVSRPLRFTGAIASFVLVLGLILLLSKGTLRPFIVGEDGRYSNSKFQMATWSFVLLWAYLSFTVLRIHVLGWAYIGGVGITPNLLLMSGLSALTFGAAKAITVSKLADATMVAQTGPDSQAATVARSLVALKSPEAPRARFPYDLLHDDMGRADFGDMQMLIITLIAVTIYVLSVMKSLGFLQVSPNVTLPEIDTTLLSVFGVGHGAYLTKKFAGDLGKS